MSTELYDAKDIVDDIFFQAKVPTDLEEDHYYNRSMLIIGHLVKAMDECGMTMDEQRRRVGAKKDELIRELIRLREQGVIRTGDEGQPIAKPIRVRMDAVQKAKRERPRVEI